MEKKRILVIGLEPTDVDAIKQQIGFGYLIVHYDVLPRVRLIKDELWVESLAVPDKFLLVDLVVFHGIFEHDYDFITMLTLWNGPCLPNAAGMMDLRQRIPGLARTLAVSKFNTLKRGMVINADEYSAETESVAKWGVWHCGEDKAKFTGDWESAETSIVEEFISGDAVRIMLVGDEHWQIKLTGESWLKSIHGEGANVMAVDSALLEDSQNIARHFKMQMIGVDYMVATDGEKYLLEANHIPNVTVFPVVNQAFKDYAVKWIASN